jgi:hypothetical protein
VCRGSFEISRMFISAFERLQLLSSGHTVCLTPAQNGGWRLDRDWALPLTRPARRPSPSAALPLVPPELSDPFWGDRAVVARYRHAWGCCEVSSTRQQVQVHVGKKTSRMPITRTRTARNRPCSRMCFVHKPLHRRSSCSILS